MAYNDALAHRIRTQLNYFKDEFTEKKMFGGLAFLYKGKMTIGVVKNDLAVRVIASKIDQELANSNVRPMDFTKRPMKEFIFVNENGCSTESKLLYYIELGLEHAKSKIGD